jgi:hypothetical protein
MNKPASALSANVVRAKRDLLDVEWVAILLATVIVCATAYAIEAVI